jgi:hypothetical protein
MTIKTSRLLYLIPGILIVSGIYYLLHKQNSSDVVGGPCSYKTINYPAKIIDIECITADSSMYELTFQVDYGGVVDTLEYGTQFEESLSGEEMREKQYQIGQLMTYEHMTIVSGSCNPDIFTLKMEPFKSSDE